MELLSLPAALLAEALDPAGHEHLGGHAVRLADLVPPEVSDGAGQIREAVIHLAQPPRAAPPAPGPPARTSALGLTAGSGPAAAGSGRRR
jgi:hypothetical protein